MARQGPTVEHSGAGDGFPLRPIRTEEELDRAIEVINELLDRDRLSDDEEDYLDVLGDLVEKYEKKHHPIAPVSDAEMLAFLIESSGRTQAEVAAESGIAESTISEVLAGKRRLNRRHIEALAARLPRQPGGPPAIACLLDLTAAVKASHRCLVCVL